MNSRESSTRVQYKLSAAFAGTACIIAGNQTILIKAMVLNSINNLSEVKATPRCSKHSPTSHMLVIYHLRTELNGGSGVETSVASFNTIYLEHTIEIPKANNQLP
ncbi:hypothetical protein V6N13_139189 [Hibiscus sabdariffa]|uniref:Uncharacterized protein n=1 Tax=Hibiscus sabdariffa TaxID=183260 RepID=A0ABR2PL35_9ROSI